MKEQQTTPTSITDIAKAQTSILATDVFKSEPRDLANDQLVPAFTFVNGLRLAIEKREGELKAVLKPRIAKDGAIDAKNANIMRLIVGDCEAVNQTGKASTSVSEEDIIAMLDEKIGKPEAAHRFGVNLTFETAADLANFFSAVESGLNALSPGKAATLHAPIADAVKSRTLSKAKLDALIEVGHITRADVDALAKVKKAGTITTKLGAQPEWYKELRKAAK